MVNVCIFNESNNVSKFDIFKQFFECVNSQISPTCCTETDAVRLTDEMVWLIQLTVMSWTLLQRWLHF